MSQNLLSIAIIFNHISQVIIILWSGGLTDKNKISWLQYLVIAKSLLMASKGPAVDFLETRSKRQASRETEPNLYLHQGFATKLPQLGKGWLVYLFNYELFIG